MRNFALKFFLNEMSLLKILSPNLMINSEQYTCAERSRSMSVKKNNIDT